MEVIIRPTAEEAETLTARLIADALRARPHLVLGLATGGTMEKVYAALAGMHARDGLDFSLCRSFNLDEYVGLPPEDPRSYRAYMKRHLFDRINIDARNTYLPDGMAGDLPGACRRYEERIAEFGGIDLQLLGIGHDGHIGFNEPLSALRSRTREKALTPLTREMNARFFNDRAEDVPARALTMGVGTILEAERIILLATGSAKAGIIARAVEGPITAMVSASTLQLHPHCTVIVDESAATDLQEQAYYRWIFANEPEWEPYR